MKTSSGALKDFLANQSQNPADLAVWLVDLYTFTLTNGTVLRWASGDRPVILAQGAITTHSLASGGAGYAVGDTGFLAGVSVDARYSVTAVDGSGAVTGYTLATPGTAYQTWASTPTEAGWTQPGNGSGFTVNVSAVDATLTWEVLRPGDTTRPAIKRSQVRSSVGFSVDDLIIETYASPLVQVGGVLLQSALRQGIFDGAKVLVQRLISTSPGDTSLGTLTVFAGTVGDVSNIGEVSARIAVNALTEILSADMPRNLYQPSCRHTLFDVGCTLAKGSFTSSGTVSSGATTITIPTSLSAASGLTAPAAAPTLGHSTPATGCNLIARTYYVCVTYISSLGETYASPVSKIDLDEKTVLTVSSPASLSGATGWNVYVAEVPGIFQLQNAAPIAIGTGYTEPNEGLIQGPPPPIFAANGYFTQGVITFTSGALSGVKAFVVGYYAGVVSLLSALPSAPAAGTTFTIVPGCDKQMTTCKQKFDNLIHFGGMPYVPIPETIL